MTAEITLYTHPMSRGRVARWMLEETGLPYEQVILEYGTSMKSADYLAINPMGKVPAIRHGDAVVTENAAICAYLAELVPEKTLVPPTGSPDRGSYYRWLFFLAGPTESLLTAQHGGSLAPARSAGYGNADDVLRTLEDALAGREHLAGDTFTAADLYAAAFLGFYLRMGAIEPRPAFVEFAQRHAARRPSTMGCWRNIRIRTCRREVRHGLRRSRTVCGVRCAAPQSDASFGKCLDVSRHPREGGDPVT